MKHSRLRSLLALALSVPAYAVLGSDTADAGLKYRGTWNGDTSQLKVISFGVNKHNDITSVEVQYHIFGKKDCGFTRTETKRFKPPVDVEGKTFRLQWDGITVHGTFTSAKAATGTVKVADKKKNCSGKTKETWTARKGAPRVDTYEGSWDGTATFQLANGPFEDEMGFEVEGDGVTEIEFPFIVEGSNCVGIGGTIVLPFDDDPIPIEKDAFSVDGQGDFSFTFDGTFDSKTAASGDLSESANLAGCSGSADATWEAARLD
jgi:hypothetical protein